MTSSISPGGFDCNGNDLATSNVTDLILDVICKKISPSNMSYLPGNNSNDTLMSWSSVEDPLNQNMIEFRNQVRFWIQRVMVPLVMIIGVIGNSVTIFIMTRRRMRSSTNIYLAALAIFDMLYLVLIFALSVSHYPRSRSVEYYIYWRLRPFALMLTDACSNTSVWLTVTFTFERYIVVSHPIRGKILCTESRAKKAIMFVALFCFTCTLPTPFEWTIVEQTDPKTNATIIQDMISDLGKNNLYKTIYYWFTVVVFIFIPLILLAIFNSFLIRSVHLSKKTRKTMTCRRDSSRDSSTQENKITVMLIAVVILFFVCQLPTAVILLYDTFTEIDDKTSLGAFIRGIGNVANFLVAVNAAGNFLLYCLLSQKYRRTFLQTFCPCLKGKITRLHSVYQHTVYSNVDNSSPLAKRRSNSRTSVEQVTLEKINLELRKSLNDCSAILPLTQTDTVMAQVNCNNGNGGNSGGNTPPSINNGANSSNLQLPVVALPKKKRLSNVIMDKIKLRRKSCSENEESSQNWCNLNREKRLVRSVSEKWPTTSSANRKSNHYNFD